ncbi:SusC/RagA family TonB-linked outer membrane protein [Chitinophaga sp. HK235]|uniref:SusC/RagA family TonB-linked outer membrane protein n=1 Tax=Chitinophaga sp. HK235 TaxID=2952571 RepID=UPI001BA63BB9|nr:SusC/RagA family TonB-linked outer membrane protein [Chitinophaga sp. HK235]
MKKIVAGTPRRSDSVLPGSKLLLKLFAVLLLCLSLQVNAGVAAQKVSLKASNITLEEVFGVIKKQTGFYVLYNPDLLKGIAPVTIDAQEQPLSNFLDVCLANKPLTYEIKYNTVVIKPRPARNTARNLLDVAPATKDISGRITDEKGMGIPGVSVSVKGTQKGIITGGDGQFHLAANPGDVLVVRMMGYETQEVTVGSDASISITIKESSTSLQQVVVTALGIKREEKSLGYAVQKVKGSSLNTVKPVDVATSLTGKVAGLNVKNSTEFNEAPTLQLRGSNALLVIDGVPYGNMSLRDIAPDDIESIDVLKGATASALYGSRGGNGAIMVTTKRGNKEGGLDIAVNSSNMFTAGFLAFPKVQNSYSSGTGGKYAVGDYVWGDKMDIGRTASQYNPSTYQFEDAPLVSKGKNNLNNFLQQSFVLNNNISVSQSGKFGSYRASLTHVYNQGQYPNTKLNKITASIAGDMHAGNFNMNGGISYNRRFYPNNVGTGYGGGGYMYNLVVWTGAEYDVRDYKNYWIAGKENIRQNWMENNWYDNPYFIANEILHGNTYDITNGYINANYQIKPWLKATLRNSFDAYSNTDTWRNAISAVGGWNKKGYYSTSKGTGFSTNHDLILSGNGKIGNFGIDALAGGALYYYQTDVLNANTQNGITIPGFYSILASVDPAFVGVSSSKKQVNSLYAKATLSYKSLLFVDVTGRNDWSSTLSAANRSYFYPSVASSLVLSEFIPMPKWMDLAKVRGSWTKTKSDPAVFEINNTYGIKTNVWNSLNSAAFPTTIRSSDLLPQTVRTYEFGLAAGFLKNRIHVDVTRYNQLNYNRLVSSTVSSASGFGSVLVNSQEQILRKGVEITVDGTVINKKDFGWDVQINWATDRRYYAKLDPIYSSQKPWVQEGARYDWISINDWSKSPDGQMIMQNGFPIRNTYETVLGYSDPNWIWGMTNNFRYKTFSFSFSFDGRVGGTSYSNTTQALWNSGASKESDNSWRYDEVVNGNKSYVASGVVVTGGAVERDATGKILSDTRTFAPNTQQVSYESYIKRYHSNAYTGAPQNYFLQTFFKLREVALSYGLPAKVSKRLGIRNASVGFVGQNVLLWTKEFKNADPDKGSDNLNSPSVRYLGFNVKVNI